MGQKAGKLAILHQSRPPGLMAAEPVVWLPRLVATEAVSQSSAVVVAWSSSICIFSVTTRTGECVGLSAQLQMAPKGIGVMKTMLLSHQTRDGPRALNF